MPSDIWIRGQVLQGEPMREFEQVYADLANSNESLSAFDEEGVRLWDALKSAPSYTCYRSSKSAFDTLVASTAWHDLLASRCFGSIFDFGTGMGENACAILPSLKDLGVPPSIVLVDLSKGMVEHAFKAVTLEALRLNVAADVIPIRNNILREVERLRRNSVLGQFLEGTAPRLFMLLGGTLSNFREDEFFDALDRIFRPNDILVFGVEQCRLIDGSTKSEEDFLKEYDSPEQTAMCVNYCRKNFGDSPRYEDAISFLMDRKGRASSIPNTISVISGCFRDAAIEIISPHHRYDEAALLDYLRSRGFNLVMSVSSPDEKFYKCFVCERI
jgi:SAM-dependent methyltransferase